MVGKMETTNQNKVFPAQIEHGNKVNLYGEVSTHVDSWKFGNPGIYNLKLHPC